MSGKKSPVLNRFHVIFLTQNIMFGTGILSLPQKLSSLGYSQGLFPLLFGVIACLTLWPMIWINSKYENDNLFRINEKLLGKWLGKSINLLIVAVYIIFLSSVINNYTTLIQTSALPEQSMVVPLIMLLLVLVYIVNGGITSIARFCMMTFFLIFPTIFFLRWAIEKGEVTHLFPLFNFNGKEALEAMKKGYLSMLGYELIMFYYPYIANKKKAFKYTTIGIWITVLLYFITVLVSVMYFSKWQLENVEYSVLHLLKAGELPFIERIDIFVITLWVLAILATASAYLWTAKKGLESLRNKKKSSHVYILTLVVLLFEWMPLNPGFQEKFYEINYNIYYGILGWPIVLCVVHLLKKKRVRP